MNEREWAEIHRRYAAGEPIASIARALQMSRGSIRRALTRPAPTSSTAEGGAPPPVRPGSASRSPGGGVPAFATDFVGRRAEIGELRALLGTHRLVTLAGTGGIGKTRLAAQTATEVRRAFRDGVCMVELAAVRSPEVLAPVVLERLGMSHLDGPGRSAVDSLVEHLQGQHLLLVLDNCEHLRAAVADFVATVLHGAADVRFLVTTREVLDLPGEHVTVLAPLSTTDARRRGEPTTAMALFASRARDVLSGFVLDEGNYAAVQRICARLDGLPLAIELACFRLRVLSVAELADRLDEGFVLLSSRARAGEERHQSLQTAMAWSYELCTAAQRLLWARTSVFVDGFDVAMAQAVCSDATLPAEEILDGLHDLVGKSILRREDVDGRVRFRVLETIREFGHHALTDIERRELQDRHLSWCAQSVSASVQAWFGPDQQEVARRLRADLANIRAALQTALGSPGASRTALAAILVASPWWLWACGLSAREHTMWLEQVLARADLDDGCRARVAATLGMVQTLQGDREPADLRSEEALETARATGDRTTAAFAMNARGLSAFFGGEPARAEVLLRGAIQEYREVLDVRADLLLTPQVHLGMLLSFTGRAEEAAVRFEEVRTRCEAAGERWMRSYAVFGLGLVALAEERFDDAVDLTRDSLRLKRDFQDSVGTPLAVELLGWAEAGAGSAADAAVLLGAASALWGAFGQHLYGSEQWVQRRARFEERAHLELGELRFARYEAQGAAMGLADLLDLATGTSDAEPGHPAHDGVLDRLSPREREVAAHVARGLTNKEIAQRLVLSHRTIEGHVEHILQKLGVPNRYELAMLLGEVGGT